MSNFDQDKSTYSQSMSSSRPFPAPVTGLFHILLNRRSYFCEEHLVYICFVKQNGVVLCSIITHFPFEVIDLRLKFLVEGENDFGVVCETRLLVNPESFISFEYSVVTVFLHMLVI